MKKTLHSFLPAISILFVLSCNSKNEHPVDVTQNFMNSCMQNGSTKGMCACMLEKIQKKYTYIEFSQLDIRVKGGQMPKELIEFAKEAKIECGE